MPPNTSSNNQDDDYIISLLKKDAESNKKRYLSNSGLGSLLSSNKRSRPNAPKPNTRFLKNIIRDTDSHNAALKAKEEEESAARLREMREGKRKRDGDEGGARPKERRREEHRPGRWASVLGGLGRGSERREDGRSRNDEKAKTRDRRAHERSRERRHHRRRHDGSDDSRSRSRSPDHRKEHRRRRSRSRSRAPPKRRDRTCHGENSHSDPLDSFIGPKPPPETLPRGRGAHRSNHDSIDIRFNPSYNPKADVDMSDEGERDDWDMALEALRDRAKWRTQGADRLRAAGFSEEEVGRWEKSSAFPNGDGHGEKDFSDVRWSKKGEGREWDRGKVLDGEGVSLRPEWGRLKGT